MPGLMSQDSSPARMTELRTAVTAALFVAIGPMSLALYTPALPALVSIFHTTPAAMKLTITVYFFGFAFAILFCGPLSDAFGRRPVVIAFFSVYLIGSLVAASSVSIEFLMLGRVLQGVGAASGVVASRALVRDQFSGQASARIMSLIGMMVGIAPAVSPTIGGVLLGTVGWYAIFIVMVIYGLGVVVLAFTLRETHKSPDRGMIHPRQVWQTYRMLLSHRTFLKSGLLAGLVQGGFYTTPALLPFALIETVGLTPVQYGLAMFAHTAAFILGATLTNRLLRRFDSMKLVTVGVCLILLSGFEFAVALRALEPSFFTIWTPSAMWVFGIAFIMPGTSTNALAPFSAAAGSAAALLGFMQFGGGLVGSAIAALAFPNPLAALMTLLPIIAVLAALVHFGLAAGGPEPTIKAGP
jgi:DHA1 family bicyclomycin/chloramphenicol resistance-like MFS transporter